MLEGVESEDGRTVSPSTQRRPSEYLPHGVPPRATRLALISVARRACRRRSTFFCRRLRRCGKPWRRRPLCHRGRVSRMLRRTWRKPRRRRGRYRPRTAPSAIRCATLRRTRSHNPDRWPACAGGVRRPMPACRGNALRIHRRPAGSRYIPWRNSGRRRHGRVVAWNPVSAPPDFRPSPEPPARPTRFPPIPPLPSSRIVAVAWPFPFE